MKIFKNKNMSVSESEINRTPERTSKLDRKSLKNKRERIDRSGFFHSIRTKLISGFNHFNSNCIIRLYLI